MKAKTRIVLLPVIDAGGCSCGSSCGPSHGAVQRTSNAEALSLLENVATELGDAVEVSVADYSSPEGAQSAAQALERGLVANTTEKRSVSEYHLPMLLSAAGPFLLLDGKIVANRILPSLENLKGIIANSAV